MSRRFLVLATVFAAALLMRSGDALAVTVSNLDEVDHVVVFEVVQGSKVSRVVKPGESVMILQHGGSVYLEGKKKRQVYVHANDQLAIWKGGKLQIQMRRKLGGDVF